MRGRGKKGAWATRELGCRAGQSRESRKDGKGSGPPAVGQGWEDEGGKGPVPWLGWKREGKKFSSKNPFSIFSFQIQIQM